MFHWYKGSLENVESAFLALKSKLLEIRSLLIYKLVKM